MKWYIGQPIVAIKNHSQGDFKKGQEFVTLALKKSNCKCSPHILIDIGIRGYSYSKSRCSRCGTTRDYDGFYQEVCFAPLDTDISELTEILEQKQIL